MGKKLHFSYESIGNLCRLLVNIMIERTGSNREITVYHQRFDREPDDTYEAFLTKLYQNGCTIGEQELKALVNQIRNFMETDEASVHLFLEYDKKHLPSYVLSKLDNKIQFAQIGEHEQLIQNAVMDWFKDFDMDDIDTDYVYKFIMDNFEIKSDYSTLKQIANDISINFHEIFALYANTY